MNNRLMRCAKSAGAAGLAALVAACGGGGYGGGGNGSLMYTVGGTISGLAAGSNGVTLQDDHANNTLITANGPFTFSVALAYGTPYNVTVLTNPTTPPQTCTITNGSGIVGYSNVTSVVVTCV